MNTRIIIFCSLLISAEAIGSLYQYPTDKRPAVSLKEACAISETILAKMGLEKEYYVLKVYIYGDEGGTGDGAWTLMYRNQRGDQIQIGVYLKEDFVVLTNIPKDGKSTDSGYTRDGRVSPKWLEWQKN